MPKSVFQAWWEGGGGKKDFTFGAVLTQLLTNASPPPSPLISTLQSRELEEGPDPAVRNNVVIILADLCIRYTSIVERFLPSVSARLRDEAPLVRRQTLTLLTRLLSEDYIKLRGVLFFRLLSTLVDSDASVRNLGRWGGSAVLSSSPLVHLLLTSRNSSSPPSPSPQPSFVC